MHFQGLSDFVGSIYDTLFDPGAWPTTLDRVADLVAATSGAAIVSYNSATRSPSILYPRADPAYIHSFITYWGHHCRILHYAGNYPTGKVLNPEMFVSRQEYCNTDIFREWFEPQRAEAMIGAKLLTEGPASTFFGLVRPYSRGNFEEDEIELFAALVPHLQRAVQLQVRLAGVEAPPMGSAEILNRLLQGVLLVDARARIVFANRAAESLLRPGGGLSLGRDGLCAEIPEETRRLRQMIAECAAPGDELGGAGGNLRLCRADRAPLTVLVAPHRSRFGWIDILRPAAMLLVTDPEQAAEIGCDWLRRDYGLTPAEALFAVEIARGDGLSAAAHRLGVSLTTVKTHLAHVFDKTGARRQAELVRLILQRQPAA
ncbi:MAG TPA: LuxR C-terminal-related transcriptional regulator [Stellaceae bacterium]|nr:LuxR C-terminal-related transcriptional regulator [Stellaceae bacterium]